MSRVLPVGGALGQEAAYEGWDIEYIRASCQVTTEGAKILGVVAGSMDEMKREMEAIVQNVRELQEAVGIVDHPATEMVLNRKCADVSKLMYAMCTAGMPWTKMFRNF